MTVQSVSTEVAQAHLRCRAPHCPCEHENLPTNTLYVSIESCDFASPGPAQYCLTCLETLWEARYTDHPHPPHVRKLASLSYVHTSEQLQLERRDDTWDFSRLETTLPSSIDITHDDASIAHDSPLEQTYPPTRSQHLAILMTSGSSLDCATAAVVDSWIATSKVQLGYTPSAIGMPQVRDDHQGCTLHGDLDFTDFQGRDLSEVLKRQLYVAQ